MTAGLPTSPAGEEEWTPAFFVSWHSNPELIGRHRPLSAGKHMLGRGASTLVSGALDDPKMSRKHALIEVRTGDATVADCESRNGTFLNGARVDRAELQPGDVLGIGDLRLVYQPVPGRFRSPNDPVLRGVGPAIAGVIDELLMAATSGATTLLLGEAGVGKELAARVLHAASGRRGALVAVNCSGLDDGVAASELFGHRRGAFTGAVADRPGLVNQAAGGTLFLDEIGDATPQLQATMLRLLQESEVRAVGEDQTRRVDLRFVAATNRDLIAEAAAGTFRRDLVTRLEGWIIRIPPLRARKEDIGPLALELARRERPDVTLSVDVADLLLTHTWPGNVRELAALIRRLVVGSDDPVLASGQWLRTWVADRAHSATPTPLSRKGARRTRPVRPSRSDIVDRLVHHGGNLTATAAEMGVGRATLYRWVGQLDIDLDAIRPG